MRSSKGIALTNEGMEFLSYARQVVEQAELMEQRYLNKKPSKKLWSISTQHYAFAVQAFVALLKALNENEYECTLRETRTHEIFKDVRNLRSEIGILYLSEFNRKVINKLLRDHDLKFHPLFIAKPHVFISAHYLANRDLLEVDDLDGPKKASEQLGIPYPTLQGWRKQRNLHGDNAYIGSGHAYASADKTAREIEVIKGNQRTAPRE